jgi:hypothetical protein
MLAAAWVNLPASGPFDSNDLAARQAAAHASAINPLGTRGRCPAAASAVPGRRAAVAPAPLGDTHRRAGDRDIGARLVDRQCRAADHRRRHVGEPGDRDLDRQRLSADDRNDPAAARLARRHLRVPARLPRWAGAVHAGVAGLRDVAFDHRADRGARLTGARRRRDHERQRRADALHLSSCAARPRDGHQRGDRLGRRGGRADRGIGDPLGRLLAMALRHQRADRPYRAVRHGIAAGDAARQAPLRHHWGRAERGDLRAHHHDDRRHRSPSAARIDRARRHGHAGGRRDHGIPRDASRRRCCRSICCGYRCSRCRSRPRSARLSRR